MMPGEGGDACRCALWHHIVVFEAGASCGGLVEVRRVDIFRIVIADIRPALIVRQDENNIGLPGMDGSAQEERGEPEIDSARHALQAGIDCEELALGAGRF